LPPERPKPTDNMPQHMCMDKGYDYQKVSELIANWGYTPHIKVHGEEISAKQKFRRLLIRWGRKKSKTT